MSLLAFFYTVVTPVSTKAPIQSYPFSKLVDRSNFRFFFLFAWTPWSCLYWFSGRCELSRLSEPVWMMMTGCSRKEDPCLAAKCPLCPWPCSSVRRYIFIRSVGLHGTSCRWAQKGLGVSHLAVVEAGKLWNFHVILKPLISNIIVNFGNVSMDRIMCLVLFVYMCVCECVSICLCIHLSVSLQLILHTARSINLIHFEQIYFMDFPVSHHHADPSLDWPAWQLTSIEKSGLILNQSFCR